MEKTFRCLLIFGMLVVSCAIFMIVMGSILYFIEMLVGRTAFQFGMCGVGVAMLGFITHIICTEE